MEARIVVALSLVALCLGAGAVAAVALLRRHRAHQSRQRGDKTAQHRRMAQAREAATAPSRG